MEKKVLSCGFNIDTACVEVKYADGSKLTISCPRVEKGNMYERFELDWLVYNVPMDYVNQLLHGNIRTYLNNATDYHPLDN